MSDANPLLDPTLFEAVEQLLLEGHPTLTRVQVAEQAGVPLDLAGELWHALGFAHVDDDDPVFTDADVTALRHTARLIEVGILDEQSQAALVRTWGRSFARLAEWQASLLTSQAARSGSDPDDLAHLAEEVIRLVDHLQTYIWRRHLLSAASRQLLRPEGTTATRAVGFVDIVGYTTRSKTLSESELVALVETFEDFAARTVTDHDGQLVKTIGDEILYVCDDPAQAARIALVLVERNAEDESFPDVRAGVAYGDVVSRLGDVFGPTVNIASRLTSLARPGKVLLDRDLAEAVRPLGEGEAPEFWLRRVRRASVKGYSRLEPWKLERHRDDGSSDDTDHSRVDPSRADDSE